MTTMEELSASSARPAAFSAHAYSLAELGWPLIRTKGKQPFERAWQAASSSDPDTAASLWANWGRRHNMGVVLGGANLAVLEYDREDARGQFFALLGGDFAPTPTCMTGSGRHHVYFRDQEGLRKAERDGLELRVGAHQCLVPPSEHPETGKPYEWLPGYEPWTLEPLPLPEHIVAFFAEESRLAPRGSALPQEAALAPRGSTPLPQEAGVGQVRHSDERSALAIAALLGLDFPRTRCPFHDDQRPSGSFSGEGKRGDWIYRCHAGCGTTSLEGLWLRAKYGVHPDWISKRQFVLWCRRLSIELGDVAITDELPPLPATYPPSISAYWNGYRLLVLCERLAGSGEWPLYAHDFAARWCGLPRSTARAARTRLMKDGWLRTTGETVTVSGFQEAHRWRPGKAATLAPVSFSDNSPPTRSTSEPVRALVRAAGKPAPRANPSPTPGFPIRRTRP